MMQISTYSFIHLLEILSWSRKIVSLFGSWSWPGIVPTLVSIGRVWITWRLHWVAFIFLLLSKWEFLSDRLINDNRMPTIASVAFLFFLKSSLVETRNIFGCRIICLLRVSSIVIEQGILSRIFGLFDINQEILLHFISDDLVEHVFRLFHLGFLILL